MLRKLMLVGFLAVCSGCAVIVGGPARPRVVVAAPRLVAIVGTPVSYVADVDGDFFFYGGAYFKIVGGAWYRTPTWGGTWVRVTAVPDVFLRIPPGHAKYHVVRHHPGYRARVANQKEKREERREDNRGRGWGPRR